MLYTPNVPQTKATNIQSTDQRQASIKDTRFPQISKLVIPRPTLQNLVYSAVGAVVVFAVMALLGGVKPLGNWGISKRTAMPVLAVYRNVYSIVGSLEEVRTIKFSELWADTEQYFDRAFIFCGTVRLPKSPAYLPDESEQRAVGPDTHSQIVIASPNQPRNDTEDIVFGFARRDLAKDLIALLGADERKSSYTGYFLLKIPTELKYINQYKQSSSALSDHDWRKVSCEVFAYGPDERTLRQALIAAKAAEQR